MEATPLPIQSDQSAPTVSLETLLPDGQPDWETITFEVNCSRCDYNLRLLPLPRCPECGLQFEWREVIDRAAHRSKFLFEHNWRKQPFRSYFTTILKSLRPFRFWKQVSIHDDIRSGPLWFLLLTSVFWFVLTLQVLSLAAWGILEAVRPLVYGPNQPQQFSKTSFYFLQEYFWAVAHFPFDLRDDHFIILGILLSGFLAAFATLCSLRQTLGRCRVRTIQVLRVMAYSAAPFWIMLAILFLFLPAFINMWNIKWSREIPEWLAITINLLPTTIPAICAVPIIAGLKYYLHLPRPTALGMTALFVGFLFSITATVLISLMLR